MRLKTGVFLFIVSFSASAQSSETLYWIRYFNQTRLTQKVSWFTEVDERRFINPDKQRQFIMHSYAHYAVGPETDLDAGLSASWVTNNNNLTVPEVRLFQMLTFKAAKVGPIAAHIRTRIEERFFHDTNETATELEDGYNFVFRSRLRFQLSSSLDKKKQWNLRLSDEIMMHSSSSDAWAFDQNRIFLGLERKLSEHFSVEVGYLSLYFEPNSNPTYFNNIRTTLFHRIHPGKNKVNQ